MPKQLALAQNRPFQKPRNATTNKRKPNSEDALIGESIRAHRLVAGMSQSELANQLGVSFQQVQKYEKGTNRVGAGRLPQLAEIFNVPISALFGGYAETSPGKGRGTAVPVNLVTDPAVLRLLTAYGDIADRSIRNALSELVELIAKSEKKNRRG